jgi:hypothetical protein
MKKKGFFVTARNALNICRLVGIIDLTAGGPRRFLGIQRRHKCDLKGKVIGMKSISIGGCFEASEIALGCWRTAKLEPAQAERLLGTALEQGVNLFDNADIYGGGMAEEVFENRSKPSVSVTASLSRPSAASGRDTTIFPKSTSSRRWKTA